MFRSSRAVVKHLKNANSSYTLSFRNIPPCSFLCPVTGPNIAIPAFQRPYSTEPKSSRDNSNNASNQSGNNAKRKPKGKQTQRNTSLRRVGVEAERSRSSGRKEDPSKEIKAAKDDNAKFVTAYCTAEQYHMSDVSKTLKEAGYVLDPHHTNMYPQVVHVQLLPLEAMPGNEAANVQGDVFIFPSGTIVAWNVEEERATNLISDVLQLAAQKPHPDEMETEDLEFIEDPDSETSRMVGDEIHLGTKFPSHPPHDSSSSSSTRHGSTTQDHETDLALTKIAFSSGLARSVKLAVLENALETYFKSTRSIPTTLSQGHRLPFTRAFILRKTGELLSARAQLNLNSELTDALPDMFWDSRHELGLGTYFEQVGRALDVNVRSRVLNQKMTYAQEIVSVLREQLSQRHSHFLEWLIILLISIEIGFEILWLWRERQKEGSDTTEALLRTYLATMLDQVLDEEDGSQDAK